MKKMIFIMVLVPFLMARGYGQCMPDTSCKDINEPGQICPDTLPAGETGVTYYEVVTIIPPDTADLGNQQIALTRIHLDTVTNMPPGVTYIAEKKMMYPDSAYCIEITGIPEAADTFFLKITVTPYTYSDVLQSEIALPPQTDSTSLFIAIQNTSAVQSRTTRAFSVLPPSPNPFSTETRLGADLSGSGLIRLTIYDLTGKKIYQEALGGNPGTNFFNFRGNRLSPGIYFYSIRTGGYSKTGKMIKSR